jgi:hypothetical protein
MKGDDWHIKGWGRKRHVHGKIKILECESSFVCYATEILKILFNG